MANKKITFTPVYTDSFDYAYAHNEYAQYNASQDANIKCKAAIENAIAGHYHDYCLDTRAAVQEVVKQFGYERMFYVLANTVQSMEWDGRISRSNKDWAQTFPASDKRPYILITRSHPGLVDLFVKRARHEYLLSQPLKAADIKAEASHILQQFQAAQGPNSQDMEHFIAQVSPDFMARAKPKDHARLTAMLPFPSLTFAAQNDGKTIAIISRDEDRSQKLCLRKPSIKAQLAAKPVPGDKPAAKAKDREVR